MRLIDGDKLKEDVNEWLSYDYKTRVDLTAVKIPNKWLNALIKCIDNQPTVDVLDKIRTKIEERKEKEYLCFNDDDMDIYMTGLNDAIDIIDKYKIESEKNRCR